MGSWIIFICLAATSWAHELPLKGECPAFDPMENFNPIGILGDWYGVEDGKNGIDEEDIRCARVDHYFDNFGIHSTLTLVSNVDNSVRVIQVPPSKAVDDPTVPHILIEGELAEISAPNKMYLTAAYSDYKDCLVVILCYTNDTNHGYEAQVLSRTTTLSKECQQKSQEVLAARDITVKMRPVVQNCDNTAKNPLRDIGIFIGNLQ